MPSITLTMVGTEDSTGAFRVIVDERWYARTEETDWKQMISVVATGTYPAEPPTLPQGNSKAWVSPYAPALFTEAQALVVVAEMNLMSGADDWVLTNVILA